MKLYINTSYANIAQSIKPCPSICLSEFKAETASLYKLKVLIGVVGVEAVNALQSKSCVFISSRFALKSSASQSSHIIVKIDNPYKEIVIYKKCHYKNKIHYSAGYVVLGLGEIMERCKPGFVYGTIKDHLTNFITSENDSDPIVYTKIPLEG
ncbi:hypothetical protein FF38_13315 [Lucilia cuprina]|uniref:Uncharacterized protein n=1 Tax=Lucilia cuprina TaxID=7375 RepID=A0A0L0CB63_LUCCU|nr:hypothetical protein FF38_13315 [Lucilia cuprina]